MEARRGGRLLDGTHAGLPRTSPVFNLTLSGLLAAFAAAMAVFFAGGASSVAVTEAPSFAWLRSELGRPSDAAPIAHRPAPGVRAALDGRGVVIARGDARVALRSVGISATSEWTRHETGASRVTTFGREAITLRGTRAELYNVVTGRRGVRTCRWRSDPNLNPRLRNDGAVAVR